MAPSYSKVRAPGPSLLMAILFFLIASAMFYNRFLSVTSSRSQRNQKVFALPSAQKPFLTAGGGGGGLVVAAADAPPAAKGGPSLSLSSPYKPLPIVFVSKAQLNNAYLVAEHEENICEAHPSGGGTPLSGTTKKLLPKIASKLADRSVLPDCPPTNPNDSSADIASFAEKCNVRDHKAWPFLNEKVTNRMGIKALKLLITNRGCDETIEPASITLKEELWSAIHFEHNNDLSVLEVGAGCGHMLEWLTTYLMGPTATENVPKPRELKYSEKDLASGAVPKNMRPLSTPRFNILSLDGRESSIRYIAEVIDGRVGQYPSTSKHLLATVSSSSSSSSGVGAEGAAAAGSSSSSSSSIKFCQADPIRDALTVGMRWSPSNTFNLVFVMDQLNDMPSDVIAEGGVCAFIEEAIRVVKVGGAVWAGHIDNPVVLKAITECRITTCGVSDSTDNNGSQDGSSAFAVEMTVIKETFFFGSPRFLTPKHLLEKKPVGVMWRKVPLSSR